MNLAILKSRPRYTSPASCREARIECLRRGQPVDAEDSVHAGQAACSYPWRVPVIRSPNEDAGFSFIVGPRVTKASYDLAKHFERHGNLFADGKAPLTRARFQKVIGATRELDRATIERARQLAGPKGYVTNLPADQMDPPPASESARRPSSKLTMPS